MKNKELEARRIPAVESNSNQHCRRPVSGPKELLMLGRIGYLLRFPLSFVTAVSLLRGNVPILKFYRAIGFHQRNIGHALTFDVIKRSQLNRKVVLGFITDLCQQLKRADLHGIF